MSERMQLKRTRGWRMPPNTIKVDRTTGYGNPFPIAKGKSTSAGKTSDIWSIGTWEGPAMWFRDTKAEALSVSVAAYREWLHQPAQKKLRDRAMVELHGKNLACWCKAGEPCHADVLLELVDPSPTEE